MGSSLDDMRSLPEEAQDELGFQLHLVQMGQNPDDWKWMQSVGPGVREVRVRVRGRAFRTMYVTVKADAVYVLHVFEKKSRQTAQRDIQIARRRLKQIQ